MAYDKQKADELAEIIAHGRTPTVSNVPVEQAERKYAQLDAARDAEIQLLIAEAEDRGRASYVPTDRRVAVVAVLRSYPGPLTIGTVCPRARTLNEHAEFRIEGWEKRECWPEAQGG